MGSAACLVTMLINVVTTIWAFTLPGVDGGDVGRWILFEGSCEKSKRINIAFPIVINLPSSVLLSASNYGIQCLSAPTRELIDRAHFKGGCVDVGVVSGRNLREQAHLGKALWLLLILSLAIAAAGRYHEGQTHMKEALGSLRWSVTGSMNEPWVKRHQYGQEDQGLLDLHGDQVASLWLRATSLRHNG